MPDTLIAFHPYGLNFYTSLRAGAGSWTAPHLYGNNLTDNLGVPYGLTCGIEGAAPTTNPAGVAAPAQPNASLQYFGNGLPDATYPVFDQTSGSTWVDNISYPTYVVEPLGYWHMSTGAWLYGGHLWICAARRKSATSENTIVMLKAIAFDGAGIPTQWHACDLGSSNEPHCDADRRVAVRWDGVSSIVDLYGPASYTTDSTPRKLYTFDFSTELWNSYGPVDPGRVTGQSLPVVNSGNTIFRFPNNDIGILYQDKSTPPPILISKIYYRLYNRALSTWGSEILVIDRGDDDVAGISTVIPDPGAESLHLFEHRNHQIIHHNASQHIDRGTYHIVEHDGTFHANLFEFPEFVDNFGGQYTGWGHGVAFGGDLFVPRVERWYTGDWPGTRTPHEVWVAPITGGATTFVREALPMPAGIPSDSTFTGVSVYRGVGAIVIPPGAHNRAYIGGFARTI